MDQFRQEEEEEPFTFSSFSTSVSSPFSAIEDNYVEYHFYPDPSSFPSLLSLCIQMLEFVTSLSSEYLWEREPFQLWVKPSKTKGKATHKEGEGETVRGHIWGRQKIGDSLEDEWMATRLVFELTRHFRGVSASIMDWECGHFLLAEAALVLPEWLTPETSTNRLWIREGQLQLLPMPTSPSDFLFLPASPHLDLSTALQLLCDPPPSTPFHSEEAKVIEAIILKRISDKDNFIRGSTHYSRCWLPVSIAALLQQCPQLVAPATLAFCERDSFASVDPLKKICSAKTLKVLTTSQSEGGEVEMCWSMVRFTRALYARLAAQPFYPSSTFVNNRGSSSATGSGSNRFLPGIPPLTSNNPKSKEHQWAILGLKLLCGFELLYSCTPSSSSRHSSSQKANNLIQNNRGELLPASLALSRFNFEADSNWTELQQELSSASPSPVSTNGEKEEDLNFEKEGERRKRRQQLYLSAAFPNRFESASFLSPKLTIDAFKSERRIPTSLSFSVFEDSDERWMEVDPKEIDARLLASEKEIAECMKEQLEKEKEKEKEKHNATQGGNNGTEGAEEDSEGEEGDEEGKELEEMISSMKQFLGSWASFEGADVSKGDAEEEESDSEDEENIEGNTSRRTGENVKKDKDESEEERDGDEDERRKMKRLMRQMDNELMSSSSVLGHSFKDNKDKTTGKREADPTTPSSRGGREEFQRMDLDLNLVKSILDSFEAQQGAPGPFSNLFGLLKEEASFRNKT